MLAGDEIMLYRMQKYKEIAEELNISVNTVKTHVTTGLNILRDEFPSSLLLLLLVHEDSLRNDSTPEGYQR